MRTGIAKFDGIGAMEAAKLVGMDAMQSFSTVISVLVRDFFREETMDGKEKLCLLELSELFGTIMKSGDSGGKSTEFTGNVRKYKSICKEDCVQKETDSDSAQFFLKTIESIDIMFQEV